MPTRCSWATSPLEAEYHDAEWGVPCHDDRMLFELLILEGAQAGLSWITVLKKRCAYRTAFSNFEIDEVARFGEPEVTAMLANPGLIRHRGKLEAAIGNARAVQGLVALHGSFDAWLWRFVDGRPVVTRRQRGLPVPATTPLSETVSRELRAAGCRFVGPTIVQAFLQAVGVLDDHQAECWRAKG